MINFKQFISEETILKEFSILGGLKSILDKIKSALSSLKFGSKTKIVIKTPKLNEEVDLKSRLGYYSEYVTAYSLSRLIKDKKLRLSERSNPTDFLKLTNDKKKELQSLGAVKSELDRMDDAGLNMATQILNDIITNGEDLNLLTFDIELTGDSGKGVTKGDLILTVSKDSEKQVIDKIVASLKAYKSSAINLSNSTYISLLKTIFYDSGSNLPKGSLDFVERFAKDFGSKADLLKLHELQNIIGSKMKDGDSKELARKHAKTTHGEVIEIIAKIFKSYYPKHKKEINERVLKMLGFDGEDDFYAAIGEAGKQKVLSSRKSKELQNMLKELTQGFNLIIERNGNTNNANMIFKSPNNQVIVNLTITFADTGGKSPQGKTNMFMNYGKMVK